METNRFYSDFAAQYKAASIQSLVENFNKSVGNNGWTAMRAAHDQAIIDEFVRRGIDLSAIHDGNSISFAHAVRYDDEHKRLVIADGK